MEYRKGRTNLSCTIFVPYDCNNNCYFCTSKHEYRDCSNFSLPKILESINLINRNPLIQEFVITGGEPFANLYGLKKIVAACNKTVYINTTLPKSDNIDAIIDFINNTDKIGGINISRHVGMDFPNVCGLDIIDKITKPIRINTVINGNFTFEEFYIFVDVYGKKKRDINLRENFRYIDFDSLKNRDEISIALQERYDYFASESCIVCNSEYYSVDDTFIVAYHRGMEHSSVIVGNKCYVNDVIIKQDGKIYRDWDCPRDDEFTRWLYYYERE